MRSRSSGAARVERTRTSGAHAAARIEAQEDAAESPGRVQPFGQTRAPPHTPALVDAVDTVVPPSSGRRRLERGPRRREIDVNS